jgi:hypothetical protein
MFQPGSAPSLSLTRRSSLLLSRLAEATSLEGHWIYFGPQSGWTTVELKKYPVQVSTTGLQLHSSVKAQDMCTFSVALMSGGT